MSICMLGKGTDEGDKLIAVRFLILVRFSLFLKTRFYVLFLVSVNFLFMA